MKQNIVLLHGLLGSLSNWEHVIRHFEEEFDIHVPALPIYDEHKENILDYLVNSLKTYIDTANLENVILIGNSLGGHIGILYAHQYPAKVNKLVLTGSSGLYENYLIGSFPRRHDYSYIQERVIYTFYDPQIATKALVDEVFEIISDNQKCFRIIKTAKITQRNYVTALLPQISIPVLLVWGREDKITPPNVGEEFNRLLPNATLIYVADCGHVPMMETPAAFNEILDRFLREN